MDGIRHRERFAEIEALMDSYFRCHIAPVMSKTRTYLTEKQGEEMMEYSTSPGGILSLMASSMQPLADPYQVLKATGEWNSKTTEDYIEMCKAEIAGSEAMQQDLAYMAERWREAVVQEVGRERYDEQRKHRIAQPRQRRRMGIAVFPVPSSQPAEHVLHHAQRTNDRTINASQQQREQYERRHDAEIQGQYRRQELNLGQPAEPCMDRSREIEKQQRDRHETKDGERYSDFSQHASSV